MFFNECIQHLEKFLNPHKSELRNECKANKTQWLIIKKPQEHFSTYARFPKKNKIIPFWFDSLQHTFSK